MISLKGSENPDEVEAASSEDDVEEEEDQMQEESSSDDENASFHTANGTMISLKDSEVEVASSEDEEVEDEEDQRQEESSSDGDDSASDVPDDEMESGDNGDDEKDVEEKSGWADAMAKVLGMQGKAAEPNKPLLLSKAKKDGEKAAVDKGDTDQNGAPAKSSRMRREEKKERDTACRSKPDTVRDRARERRLAKLATRGVVQLFNAVREQQKSIKSQLDVAGKSTVKRDKVFKSIDKEGFLEVLSGNKRRLENAKEKTVKVPKTEVKEEDESSWKILRDDFMMGAKMKDWDKEGSDDNE